MQETEPKQVIVIRKDLKMRRGKEIAQGSHASLGAVFLMDEKLNSFSKEIRDAYDEWRNGQFSKICLQVNSEEELLEIFQSALSQKLPVKLITDSGRTEFNGVPTKTCLAIGPAPSNLIDKVTGDLKLY